MTWEEVSWVLRGRLRSKVLAALDKPKTATMLSKELQTHRSTISEILIELARRKLAVCLDPKEPYNRFYKKTELGNKINKKATEL